MRGCSSGSNIQLSSANALTLLLLLSRTASKRAEDDQTKQVSQAHPRQSAVMVLCDLLTVRLIGYGAVADLVMSNRLC